MSVQLRTEGDPIEVQCDAQGRPLRFTWQGRSYTVQRVCNRWHVSEEWWRAEPTAWHEYIKLVTRDRLLCLLVHNLDRDQWSLLLIYD